MTEEIEEVNNGVGVVEQSRGQSRKRKARRTWRKRMRNVVLSPFHFFQKYVLRKKRSRLSKKSLETLSKEGKLRSEAVEASKRRNRPCYFLFLGLSQSGKSTTISKLFNTERPTSSHSRSGVIQTSHNSGFGNELGLRIVDTPGFTGTRTELDTHIAVSLSNFLNQELPSRIPTITFLVSRLDDDGANQSNFKEMLKSLSQIKLSLTDDHHSNIILLLTHSQKAEMSKTESEIGQIVESYQSAVSAFFPSSRSPVHVLCIENIRHSTEKPCSRYHDIVFDALRNFATVREELVLGEVLSLLSSNSRSFSVPFKKECFPVARYLSHISSNLEENLPQKIHDYAPYFVLHHRDELSKKGNSKAKDETLKGALSTCIPAGSQLVLASRKEINIEDCLVGDKLLSLDSTSPSFITKISRQPVQENSNAIGTIYCAVKEENLAAASNGKLVYKYENGSFVVEDVTKANLPEKASANSMYYFIETDSGDESTFVLNGFPCYVECQDKEKNM